MTKLQKRSPPAYPGLSTNTISPEGGIRYESLSQDTRQPVPLMASDDQAAVSGGLGSNNPYNTTRHQQVPTFQIFSPVSPMDAPEQPRAAVAATQIHAPQPHRQSMDARKSVELRRLDGTPYMPDQVKKYRVAKDGHEGALPPAYQPPTSDTTQHPVVSPRPTAKSNQNTPSQSRVGSTPHSRVASQESASVSRATPSSSPVVAGPSTMPGPRRCCHKCGKMKRPNTVPMQQSQFNGIPSAPNSAPLPGPPSQPARPGISISQGSNINGITPQIDVIPPSASTYHPNTLQSPFSQYGDETPLVQRATQQSYSIFRNSSLVRSLSRRLSGKDKRVSSDSGPLPSQQLRASQMKDGGEQGRLINMISKAINESGEDSTTQQYSRLSAHEQPSRPSSPFSFMETTNENEGYELKDLKDAKQKSPTSPDSMYSPTVIQETLDVDVDRRSKAMRSVSDNDPRVSTVGALGVPGQTDGNRPPITRFKSLRQGVGRAASVTRATSLRRLESLKTVHTAWYRDDLAIDGEHGESMNIPVY